MAGLIFGIADYTAELGVDPSACLGCYKMKFFIMKKKL